MKLLKFASAVVFVWQSLQSSLFAANKNIQLQTQCRQFRTGLTQMKHRSTTYGVHA